MWANRRFFPSGLISVEDVEAYALGGYHPMSIGDSFAQGRYKLLHKLGYGGSSTVWLAREQGERERLVTLKALRADASNTRTSAIPSLIIPEMLRAATPPCTGIQTVDHHFFAQGPNGSHLFLVSPLAGPSIRAMSDSPGRMAGSRRLRAGLARKVAKQISTTLECMHRAGVVHGDLTASNILFSLSPHVLKWSDAEIYVNLGEPETEDVRTIDKSPCPPSTPAQLVEVVDNARLTNASFLQESVLLADFGQSYAVASQPQDYTPGTTRGYCPPEMRFDKRVGFEADVWMLGCAIFEIRSGFAIFSSFYGGDSEILQQTVEILGRLPDPWWAAFEDRALWFEEDGEPKRAQDSEGSDTQQARKSSIREQLRRIGTTDEAPYKDEGPMIEKSGIHLREEEVELLGDLLEKMLKYRPEERIKMEEVIAHPWFSFSD